MILRVRMIFAASLALATFATSGVSFVRPQEPTPKPSVAKKPEPPTQQQDEVVRLRSRLVQVPVSASDASGTPIRNLAAGDFALEEDGRPQQIIAVGEPGKTPVEIALLFDVSASVRAQFRFEQQAAVQFIQDVLKPIDSISVFAIGSTPRVIKERTKSGEEAVNGLMQIDPVKEPTAFYDSIARAAAYLGQSADAGSRRVLVVISDGEENYSKSNTLQAALAELQKNDCLFYSINPTGASIELNTISIKGQKSMEAMSAQTGGKAFVPEKAGDLVAVFQQIAGELQAQYLLQYYSNDSRSEGGFHRIEVRVPGRAGVRVRARQGYFTSAP